MTFQINKPRKYINGRRGLLAFSICVILFVTIEWLAPHLLTSLASSIATPFWRSQFAIQSGSLQSTDQLLNEIESLRLEIQNMQAKEANISAIIDENIKLKSILGIHIDSSDAFTATTTRIAEIIATSTFSYRIAPVIMRPPYAYYDELIIDGGSDRGFKIGDKIYAAANILIGKIVDVTTHTSKVLLYSSPGQSYEVLAGSSSIPVTAKGIGGGQYSADISRDVEISVGDSIINPSISELPFGIVRSVKNDASHPFQTILFAPSVNIYNLRWVMIKK